MPFPRESVKFEIKCKQYLLGFEFRSPIPFPTIINVTLSVPPGWMSRIAYTFHGSWTGQNIYEVSKVGDRSQGRPEGSLFNSYYTEVWGRVLLLSLDCSTLPLICTLYCWVLCKEVSSRIFKIFGMTQPRIEPQSPRPLANNLPARPMSRFPHIFIFVIFNTVFLLVYFSAFFSCMF